MTFRLTVNGVEQARTELLKLGTDLPRRVIEQMAQIAFDATERGADGHTKTGALRQSVFIEPSPDVTSISVGHDLERAPHALFVLFGTRPHKITPRNRKALRWASSAGFRFARSVNHPGYVGDQYLYRAADDAVRQFASIVDSVIAESSTPT